MGASAVWVAMSMGVTVPSSVLTTRAIDPSGVMATATGSLPTSMGVSAVWVARSTGTTVSLSELTA